MEKEFLSDFLFGGDEKMFTLEEIKQKSIPIAKKYGIKNLFLFGSYARGEANEESDLDFLGGVE